MLQIISKNGIDICVTSVPYHPSVIRAMKQAGYKIRTEEDDSLLAEMSSRSHIDDTEEGKYDIDWFDLYSEEDEEYA